MAFRVLVFFLISGINIHAQDTLDTKFFIYSSKGEKLSFDKVFKEDKVFGLITPPFCIGCVSYLNDYQRVSKFLVVEQNGGITSISNFQQLNGVQFFFIFKPINFLKVTGEISLIKFSNSHFDVIDMKNLEKATNHFSITKKLSFKQMKND
jgi:hypothetical protein